jgi:hypothetical protein
MSMTTDDDTITRGPWMFRGSMLVLTVIRRVLRLTWLSIVVLVCVCVPPIGVIPLIQLFLRDAARDG